jgi:hypothetical protein
MDHLDRDREGRHRNLVGNGRGGRRQQDRVEIDVWKDRSLYRCDVMTRPCPETIGAYSREASEEQHRDQTKRHRGNSDVSRSPSGERTISPALCRPRRGLEVDKSAGRQRPGYGPRNSNLQGDDGCRFDFGDAAAQRLSRKPDELGEPGFFTARGRTQRGRSVFNSARRFNAATSRAVNRSGTKKILAGCSVTGRVSQSGRFNALRCHMLPSAHAPPSSMTETAEVQSSNRRGRRISSTNHILLIS